MSINFRNAVQDDIQDILKIEHASFHSSICESEEVYRARVGMFPEGFRIAENGEETIGFISSELWRYRKELQPDLFELGHSINDQHDPNGEELYISSMGMLPEFRGRGLGKMMFQAFLEYVQASFPHVTSVILIVSAKWTEALRIYQRFGFEEIMTLENFFVYQTNGLSSEDGIVMRKSIIRAKNAIFPPSPFV